MADVLDVDIVMAAPEERHRIEPLARAQHVASGDLPLPLGDHPMLDTDTLARTSVRPSGHVARGKDAWCIRFQVLIDGNTPVHSQSGLFGEPNRRPDTDAHDH